MFGLRIVVAVATVAVGMTFATASPAMRNTAENRPPCSVLTARDRILASNLPRTVKDAAGGMNGGGVDRIICKDVTGDGRIDMTVLVSSGGTAEVTAWVVFRGRPTAWQLVLQRTRVYKASVRVTRGDPVETQPVFRKSDQNCCPTGGYDHRRYHWKSGRFILVKFWHTVRP